MQNSPIRLGPIDLQDFEVPQSIRFGGRQRLVVHTLAGGRRIVERLGPDDDEIQFRGTFSGADAEWRAKVFDDLRSSGDLVWLTWKSFRRQVIVKSFTADYHSPWWITYQVSCVVVDQLLPDSLLATTIVGLVSADLDAASQVATAAGVSVLALQAALAEPEIGSAGSGDRARTLAAVTLTSEAIADGLEQQSAAVAAPFAVEGEPASFGSTYTSLVAGAGSLAALATARSYVGRIGTNIMLSGS